MAKTADRLAGLRLRGRASTATSTARSCCADRAQGQGRGRRLATDRGADADQGARPDGGARGEPRGGQGRGGAQREAEPRSQAEVQAEAKKTATEPKTPMRESNRAPKPRSRGRRAPRRADQPRQGALARRPGSPRREVIDYYARVAAALLPHLRGRPLTLKPLPRRRRGAALLREALPRSTRPTGCKTAPIEMGTAGRDQLLRLRRPRDAGLARAARGARAAPVAVARRRSPSGPTVARVRPRPG